MSEHKIHTGHGADQIKQSYEDIAADGPNEEAYAEMGRAADARIVQGVEKGLGYMREDVEAIRPPASLPISGADVFTNAQAASRNRQNEELVSDEKARLLSDFDKNLQVAREEKERRADAALEASDSRGEAAAMEAEAISLAAERLVEEAKTNPNFNGRDVIKRLREFYEDELALQPERREVARIKNNALATLRRESQVILEAISEGSIEYDGDSREWAREYLEKFLRGEKLDDHARGIMSSIMHNAAFKIAQDNGIPTDIEILRMHYLCQRSGSGISLSRDSVERAAKKVREDNPDVTFHELLGDRDPKEIQVKPHASVGRPAYLPGGRRLH